MKIIGLMCAWAAEDWIELAIQQALNLCDEVIVSIGPHSHVMKNFEDSTMDLAKKYPVTFVKTAFSGNHSSTKATTMNNMLACSKNWKVGNWVWLLDVDEFYFIDEVNNIKSTIKESEYNAVRTNEKFFFVNMRNYIKNTRVRLWRITDINNRFYPTNNWTGDRSVEYFYSGEGMFHFSMLLNPYAKRSFWASEYAHDQDHKVKWLNSYLENKFDLSIFKGMDSNNGNLFYHEGHLPEIIEGSKLKDIEDFRDVYRNRIGENTPDK